VEQHGKVSGIGLCLEKRAYYYILQYKKSGLTEAVLNSCITTEDAEQKVLQFLEQHLPGLKGSVPLAGNSVHADKQFLEKEMPLIIDHLHYRIIGKLYSSCDLSIS
jgi:oligoribonuclease (3'-5' exoribonuclease)